MEKPEEMEEICDPNILVTLNLRYGSEAKPLKTLAFAQLAVKTLFLSGGSLTLEEVSKNISKLIGVRNISQEFVAEGLNFLIDARKIRQTTDRYFLLDETRSEIKNSLQSTDDLLNGVLKRHFPQTDNRKNLKHWFYEASASFFGHYGDEWVASICKGTKPQMPPSKSVDDLLSSATKKYNIGPMKQSLVNGFLKFLASSDFADQRCLMSFGQAMFSARLVAAGVGADPLALDELLNARILLDTNVLFALSLEQHKLSKSLNTLGAAFKSIKCDSIYLNVTKEEYARALSNKRNSVLEVVKVYSFEVLRGAKDSFLQTALARGCKKLEDFEVFFDSMKEVVKDFCDGYTIQLEDDADIARIETKASQDKKLKDCIRKYAEPPKRKWPKNELSQSHDATLFHVANDTTLNGDRKCWILSLDKSLLECAFNLVGPHGMPNVLSVDALIEILALNNAGPDFDASNFAPLLANIILANCAPQENTYDLNDLHQLHRLNERAVELPAEDVKELIRDVARARIEGKKLDDQHIQLIINRKFQEKRIHYDKELSEARQINLENKEAIKEEMFKRSKLQEKFVSVRETVLKREALWRFGKRLVWRVPVAIAITIATYLILENVIKVESDKVSDWINYSVAVLALIGASWKLCVNSFLNYALDCKNAKSIAIEESKS